MRGCLRLTLQPTTLLKGNVVDLPCVISHMALGPSEGKMCMNSVSSNKMRDEEEEKDIGCLRVTLNRFRFAADVAAMSAEVLNVVVDVASLDALPPFLGVPPGAISKGALGELEPGEPMRPAMPSPIKRRRWRSKSVRSPRASTVRSVGTRVFVPETLRT